MFSMFLYLIFSCIPCIDFLLSTFYSTFCVSIVIHYLIFCVSIVIHYLISIFLCIDCYLLFILCIDLSHFSCFTNEIS